MITVRPQGNYETGFIVEGHAGYAPQGQDIVCASVSVLTYAVATEIATYTRQDDQTGFLMAVYDNNPHHRRIVRMMLRTLNELSSQYPENLEVIGYDRGTEPVNE